MRPRGLFLGVGAALALAAVWALDRTPHGPGEGEQPLVPGFADQVGDVTAVTVAQGAGKVTLHRGEDGAWSVAEMNDYPAERGAVADLLAALARSDLAQPKTARPARYAALGLDADSARHLVVRREDDVAVDLFLGKISEHARETFVRYPGDPQTWSATGRLSPSARPKDWLESELLDVSPARVRSVVLRHPPAGDLTLARSARGEAFTLAPPPAGGEVAGDEARLTANQLAHLAVADVLPRSAARAELPDSATFTTFDGLTVTFRARHTDKGDDWYAVDAAAAEGAGEPVENEAGAITERGRDWLYRFSPLVMRQLAIGASPPAAPAP